MDRPAYRTDEAGTSLPELLVVIVLFSVVGLITTTGIVRGFNAQLDATNVAETLDGMRLATQRVRDYVREADEVCASSTDRQLVLWTDDNADGAVQDSEKDIFELDTTVTPPVFQRRVPAAGETQIIRDDILNGAIFIYDGDPARVATDQPASLQCLDAGSVTDTASRIRSVSVEFTVDHPDPSKPDLSTATAVRIRNADLVDKPNSAPVAKFTVECAPASLTCTFDGSPSSDPDGTIVNYVWDFGDGTTGSGVTATHTYPASDTYTVTLLVVDDDGAVDTLSDPAVVVTAGNPPATASFVLESCTGGLLCTFDANASSDDSGIVQYQWNFGDGKTAVTTSPKVDNAYSANGTYAVTLKVIAADGDEAQVTKSVTVGNNVIRVASIASGIANKTNTYDVTYTIQLSRTTTGTPGSGITISVELTGGRTRTDSCSTNSSGRCSITVKSITNTALQSLAVTNVTDTTSTFTYDPNQDVVDQLVVDKNNNKTYYKDGVEVTP